MMSEYLENIGGLNNNSLCNILNTIDDNDINQDNVNHMTIRHSPYLDDEAFKSFNKNKHNVICIQESWLGENDDPLFYSLDGYIRIIRNTAFAHRDWLYH